MNKRFWQWTSGLAITAMVVAGCTPGAASTPTQAPAPTNPPATQPPAATATTEAAQPAGDIDCMGAQPGDTLSMLYQWSGTEEERWNQILQPLIDACGIVAQPESTRDQALLDTRVQGGNPPDIAFWNVTQLTQYQDKLKTMDELGADASNYKPFFTDPG